ncbi:MAG: hypothetical protein GY754_17055 [bacterium]|nr:hypothetical protein [bacterium]
MELEKTKDKYSWFKSGNLKFRIKELQHNESILWATYDNYDLCYTLVIWDFLFRCEDELNLSIQIDNSWLLCGYKTTENPRLLMGEINFFLSEWNVETDKNDNRIDDNQWYST